MDPNAALDEIRSLVKGIQAQASQQAEEPANALATAAIELAERFEDLDEWLVSGAFLPAAWDS